VKFRDERFPKTLRLRRRNEFLGVQRGPFRLVTQHFIVYARPAGDRETKLGITVSRKVGRAHQRNRIKRVVREVFRKSRADMPRGLNVVMVARPGRGLPGYENVVDELLPSLIELKGRVEKRQGKRNS